MQLFLGYLPDDGVEDMTILTNIDEYGINKNLKIRYAQNNIYVSVLSFFFTIMQSFEYLCV